LHNPQIEWISDLKSSFNESRHYIFNQTVGWCHTNLSEKIINPTFGEFKNLVKVFFQLMKFIGRNHFFTRMLS